MPYCPSAYSLKKVQLIEDEHEDDGCEGQAIVMDVGSWAF